MPSSMPLAGRRWTRCIGNARTKCHSALPLATVSLPARCNTRFMKGILSRARYDTYDTPCQHPLEHRRRFDLDEFAGGRVAVNEAVLDTRSLSEKCKNRHFRE